MHLGVLLHLNQPILPYLMQKEHQAPEVLHHVLVDHRLFVKKYYRLQQQASYLHRLILQQNLHYVAQQ